MKVSQLGNEKLCMLVHARTGTGKSWLGQTSPAPRLVLDAEGGSRWARRHGKKVKMIEWNPEADAQPPKAGDWETCIVNVRKFETMRQVFQALNENKHPFKTLVLDSLTEIQDRCKDSIREIDDRTKEGKITTISERQWGLLLDQMKNLVRAMRDLKFHPHYPINVVILAITQKRDEVLKPSVQGKLATDLAQYVDVEGYLGVYEDETGATRRAMRIQPTETIEAKDRTHTLTEVYGEVIADPDIESIIQTLNNSEEK